MSLAEEMLMSMPDDSASALSETNDEPHILIGEDRSITVPTEIKMIGVQLDKDVETLVFDCPRYVEDVDLSEFVIYINYMLPDGKLGTILPYPVTIDESDDTIIHFEWLVETYLTQLQGTISFNVTAKKTDDSGNLIYQWSTLVSNALTVSKGMESGQPPITPEQQDLINQIFALLDQGKVITSIEYVPTEASGAYNRLKINVSNGRDSWSEEYLIRNGKDVVGADVSWEQIKGIIDENMPSETWVFTLEDGSTVTKSVCLKGE